MRKDPHISHSYTPSAEDIHGPRYTQVFCRLGRDLLCNEGDSSSGLDGFVPRKELQCHTVQIYMGFDSRALCMLGLEDTPGHFCIQVLCMLCMGFLLEVVGKCIQLYDY